MRRIALPLVLVCLPLVACGGKDSGSKDSGSKESGTPDAGMAGTPSTPAADGPAPGGKAVAALDKGAALLRSLQGADGSWGDPEIKLPGNVGYTAMALTALAGATPREARATDAALTKALEFVIKNQKEDGSIWDNERFVTYQTSAAISALALVRRPDLASAQARARDFLASTQIQGSPEDPSYGGFPYKSKKPQAADLSNLQFAADALASAGLPADHPVWQRIQAYLKRVHNRSEGNVLELVAEIDGEQATIVAGNDGGAAYAPDQSKAGVVKCPDGKVELRSYGSMTYALLKCLILSGVDAGDPRIVAALGWLTRNWTLERNPGFEADKDAAKAGQQGLYYYYFTLARTLALYEKVTRKPLQVRDADGAVHDWRAELAARLVSLQGADGGWKNEQAERWDEGSRTLATSYALAALAMALGRLD
jgi:squalene-hopene/tetraprenyl-beta-curcumene cyclase